MKMKIAAKILFMVGMCLFVKAVEVEENVLVLNDKNFDEEIKNHKFLLVEFYAPWCGHCKSLAPEYAQAAGELQKLNPPIYLAKVDATENNELSKIFSIEGFPTLKFLKNGEFTDYNGGRTAADIVAWIKKKTGPSTTEINSVEEVESLKSHNDVIVVFFGDKSSDNYKLFEKIADSYEDVLFGQVTSKEAISHYNVQDGAVVLFKNFDERRNDFTGNFNEEEVREFINSNMIPLISGFDERTAEFIFGSNKAGLFYFRSTNSPSDIELDVTVFGVLAPKYKGKLYFVATDIKGELEERLAEYYGLTESTIPHVRITDVKGEEEVKNYVLEGPINQSTVENFINDFFAGSLTPYLRSEEIPTEQNEAVLKVVGKTFEQLVLNSNKHVLLELYAPWCGHCQSFAPIYESIAEHYKNQDNIIVAKIDATANEIANLIVQSYPTIKFYHANNKSHSHDYEGDREFDDVINWVDELITPGSTKDRPKKTPASVDEVEEEDDESETTTTESENQEAPEHPEIKPEVKSEEKSDL